MSSYGRQQYRKDDDQYLYLTGDEPLVRKIVRETFPRYRKRTFRLHVTDTAVNVRPRGSRTAGTDFVFYDLDTQEIRRVLQLGDEDTTQRRMTRLPARIVCVEHRIIEGRDQGIVLHVTKDDAAPLLPTIAEGLTVDEQIVLRYTGRYMASYGGNTRWRQTRAEVDTGITLERWNQARDHLVELGLLTTKYGLTPDGANHVRLRA